MNNEKNNSLPTDKNFLGLGVSKDFAEEAYRKTHGQKMPEVTGMPYAGIASDKINIVNAIKCSLEKL